MNNFKPSKFITFEGGDGCGKSTQSKMLYQYLTENNIQVDLTREVGGTVSAEKMRNILLDYNLLPMSELLQVMAARYEHIHTRIIPSLQLGNWVLCDRFIDSSACYQGQYPEIGIDLVYNLHRSLMSNILPNITFLIDIEPNIAIKRAVARSNSNKFDNKDIEFYQMIYDGFQYIATKFPDRIVQIKSSGLSAQETHAIIVNIIEAD